MIICNAVAQLPDDTIGITAAQVPHRAAQPGQRACDLVVERFFIGGVSALVDRGLFVCAHVLSGQVQKEPSIG